MKPDVVFFGESLPKIFDDSIPKLVDETDLLIIIGTSLAVYPFAGLSDMVLKGCPRIVVNKGIENAQRFKFNNPDVPDLAFESDCDSFFRELANLCGWGDDLDRLVHNVPYLGALDFGTGSTRFIVFDKEGNKIVSHQIELTQYFPASNMHEQDPQEYISTALECIEQATKGIDPLLIKGIGISNQRETIIAWDKESGKPLHRSIIWDDTRTADICQEFADHSEKIKNITGLPISTYFSATKILWLIRNVPEVAQALDENRCFFGTGES